jgi:hypothetical protein
VKQLGFAWFQAVQKPFALSFHVPALPLPDCSSGSRVVFPSAVKTILNFAPDGDTAVNGCPVKKVAFISFGAMGSAVKAALAPKSVTAIVRPVRSTQKSPFRAAQFRSRLSRSRSTARFLNTHSGAIIRHAWPPQIAWPGEQREDEVPPAEDSRPAIRREPCHHYGPTAEGPAGR